MKKILLCLLISFNITGVSVISIQAKTNNENSKVIEANKKNENKDINTSNDLDNNSNELDTSNNEKLNDENTLNNKKSNSNLRNAKVNEDKVSIIENKKNNIMVVKNTKLDDCKIIVERLYNGFYNRKADQDGLNYWSERIYNNKESVASVIINFMNSDEFKSKAYSDEEYINVVYKSLFGRNVDNSGLNYWISILRDGASRKYVLYRNINSPEFDKILNDFSISNKGDISITIDDRKNEIKDLMRDLYTGFYGRKADENGVNYWTSQLLNNNKSMAHIIEAFINSEEMKNKYYSNEEFVEAAYKGILGRKPDKEGHEYWTNMLNMGNSRKFVVYNNFNSKEYQDRLNSLGIKNKGKFIIDINDKKGQVKEIIYNFYEGFHGRKADESGADYWTNEIVNGRKSVSQVVEEFVNSQEFKNNNYTNEEYVKAIYRGILGRDTDVSGLNYWLNQIINGKSNKYVLNGIFNSSEFKNKLDNIGIKNKGNIVLTDKDTQSTVAKARVIIEPMNLRNKPSQKNSVVLKEMPIGSDIVVLDRVKGDIPYYKVQYVADGKVYEGYVSVFYAGKTVIELYQDNSSNEFLGVLSEMYESNGDPGQISNTPGDYGGKSYGAWQLSAKTGSLDSFVNWLEDKNYDFYKELTDARKLDINTNCGPNFDNAWTNIADNHHNTFYYLQQQYTKEAFYDALLMKLVKTGDYSKILSSFAARNVIWSTVVQHGVAGAYYIIATKVNETNDIEAFIKGVYAERGRRNEDGELVHFYSNSQAVQESVARRFKREEKEAIQMYRFANE